MILVIPAIELRNGQCRRRILGEPGMEAYYDYLVAHPHEVARLLRQENARTLHIVDLDALDCRPTVATRQAIEHIIDAVDIPIELLSAFPDIDECLYWIDKGAFRLVLTEMIVTVPDQVKHLVAKYSSSRIVAGIRARNRVLHIAGQQIDDVAFAAMAKACGIRRIIYSDIAWEGTYQGPDFDVIKSFAQATCMNITVAGGIDTPEELWRCNQMQPLGVDSVIVGRAIAENRFPCQHIWRKVESLLQKNFPLPSENS
ncbi:MAG: HisA/HisF-related TIM barrel protein [Bacteroidota bacterium]|nr:HisA/HisF-related TIM barrel protein [Candidatus Kapabacteria bacterium]MCS7302390.1 HisA/HisF-related TIM barrel protein [Candidatus Kapabacteria bacterium]MCX7937136.1 HisA/HisF-related TIM barrel protein [Chlorobiota bacterium]MDW8074629.1 HisA/HisF-related TIM barrel protein [Bacteroidota bacterium]MDW8270895.1 HisA/HisF-related TIM barrel protein [Bacteroidota bacterium]